jgi:hypothetical protein
LAFDRFACSGEDAQCKNGCRVATAAFLRFTATLDYLLPQACDGKIGDLMRRFVFSMLLACTASGFAGLDLVEKLDGQAHGLVLGQVMTVLNGECTGTMVRKVPEHSFLYALGGGAVEPDASKQGEGLIVNGRLFIKSLDASCDYCTRSSNDSRNEGGWSPFIAGVDFPAKPVARCRLTGTSESVEQIYTELVPRHGKLLGIAGVGRFGTIETSAIRKAPSYGEPILGPKRSEYFHPKAVLTNQDAIFFGMVLRSAADETSATRMVFYVNPDDKSSAGVQSHTHFATLSSRDGVDPSKPETALGKVEAVAHLLTQSRMLEGEIVVYRLDDLTSVM